MLQINYANEELMSVLRKIITARHIPRINIFSSALPNKRTEIHETSRKIFAKWCEFRICVCIRIFKCVCWTCHIWIQNRLFNIPVLRVIFWIRLLKKIFKRIVWAGKMMFCVVDGCWYSSQIYLHIAYTRTLHSS